MHVDLWSPYATEDVAGLKIYPLNSICDLTQFTVSSSTYCILSYTLAQPVMVDILLIFGMCSMVTIDEGSTFKGVFIDMCIKLKTNYWCMERGNHRSNLVERYHRHLNKTQAIAGNDQCTNIVIIQNAKASQYA